MFDEIVNVERVPSNDEPRAPRNLDFAPLPEERLVDRVLETCPDALRLEVALQFPEDHQELVASPSQHGISRSHDSAHPRGDRAQHAVARVVSEESVDPLEAVEISKNQTKTLV
ncbi:MAG: hypothetical protein AAGA81_20065, partial [Acidobacteriota bacterium]